VFCLTFLFRYIRYLPGIFDLDGSLNPLSGAHKAYVAYCTSDAFMGDRPASNETGGWHFRGQRVVQAVMQVRSALVLSGPLPRRIRSIV
jgi:hypothetical protein